MKEFPSPPWSKYAGRFDALSRRERGIVAAALAAGIVLLGYSFAIEPAMLAKNRSAAEAAQAATDLATARAVIAATAKSKDPDEPNRMALAQARQEMAAIDERFRRMEASMVPPEKMQAFLEALLSRHKNLELISLATLPPTPLRTEAADKKAGAAAPGEKQPALYRHGIEITIAGSYGDLTAYLAALEAMPQRVIWSKVALAVDKHPRSILTLTVFTLSLDSQWLVV
ncbi:MAG: hypothetical protein OHM77_10945 [Candidatus Nitricoxidivorans perseverans]|uniref:Type II secretion system protein M n=1 Tax=Candidatus Nitricoxidivorans perseverans TaxID=2975601 RepID=A0AA49IY83_9PROT|nr:MAG: hypothetical protein OHM77_10945 [Candidatus Nitricoxidivorans perseverans]